MGGVVVGAWGVGLVECTGSRRAPQISFDGKRKWVHVAHVAAVMDRIEARLTSLPVKDLAALAAEGMRKSSEVRLKGEEMLAMHAPLPEEAVIDVLLSPDLLSSLLSTLKARDGYTARVCKAWQLAWTDKNHGLLRPVSIITDANLGFSQQLVGLPGGGVMVPNCLGNALQTFSPRGTPQAEICCGDIPSVVVVEPSHSLRGLHMPSAVALIGDGTAWVIEREFSRGMVKTRLADGERLIEVADPSLVNPNSEIVDLVLAGDSLIVLCQLITVYGDDDDEDELIYGSLQVRDAATGEFQRTIDAACRHLPLVAPMSMCVHGELLFIADTGNHRVVVCRHADGAHVRVIGRIGILPLAGQTWAQLGTAPGELKAPAGVAVGHGRLYVSESCGCRIQVLTLEGVPLQVLDSPNGRELGGICVDGNRVWCLEAKSEDTWLHLLTVE